MRETVKMTKLKGNQKGITLIALVITIIVLLILAGVAISMLSGENGILRQAASAKTRTEEKTEFERVQLAVLSALTAGRGEVDLTKPSDKENSIDKAINDEFGNEIKKPTYEEGKITLSNGKEYTVTSSGKLIQIDVPSLTGKQWSYTDDTKTAVTDGKNTFNVGDVVTYNEQTATTTYTVSRNDSGRINDDNATEDQVVEKKALTWKVLGVNEEHRLVLISTEDANPVTLYGRTGGDNAEALIDDVYNKFYGNESKGTVAHGIKRKDVNNVLNQIGFQLIPDPLKGVNHSPWSFWVITNEWVKHQWQMGPGPEGEVYGNVVYEVGWGSDMEGDPYVDCMNSRDNEDGNFAVITKAIGEDDNNGQPEISIETSCDAHFLVIVTLGPGEVPEK